MDGKKIPPQPLPPRHPPLNGDSMDAQNVGKKLEASFSSNETEVSPNNNGSVAAAAYEQIEAILERWEEPVNKLDRIPALGQITYYKKYKSLIKMPKSIEIKDGIEDLHFEYKQVSFNFIRRGVSSQEWEHKNTEASHQQGLADETEIDKYAAITIPDVDEYLNAVSKLFPCPATPCEFMEAKARAETADNRAKRPTRESRSSSAWAIEKLLDADDDDEDKPKVEEFDDEEAKEEKRSKKSKEVSHEWDHFNSMKPLWMRKSETAVRRQEIQDRIDAEAAAKAASKAAAVNTEVDGGESLRRMLSSEELGEH